MNIKTDSKTTIETTIRFDGMGFRIPLELDYDGQEQSFKSLNLDRELKDAGIPKGEYKMTITLEKIG